MSGRNISRIIMRSPLTITFVPYTKKINKTVTNTPTEKYNFSRNNSNNLPTNPWSGKVISNKNYIKNDGKKYKIMLKQIISNYF
tara:strand:- start:658 stop:909 length:252 start_codon:yes stop_codon:yes gene_type:complete